MSVRRARTGDETLVAELRLQALTDAPDDFDSTLARESRWTIIDWRRFIERGAVFVFEDDRGARGMAGGIPHWDEANAVALVAMWVHPDARGSGAADTLVSAVIDWARAEGARAVTLHVLERNARSRRFYERNGFRPTGERIVSERTGLMDVEMRRELD
jgi:RimJ/RimL family protein N-acetyltransferase